MKRRVCDHVSEAACQALSRQTDDEAAMLSELTLLIDGEERNGFAMAELTFVGCDRGIGLSDAFKMLLEKF